MRSRYTAFCQGNADYLLASWHPTTRPPRLDLSEPPVPKWIGLAILAAPPATGDQGQVEFLARYRVGGRAQRLHERSRFLLEGGRWYYLDGEILEPSPGGPGAC
jgi:SEC-C motif-containing protein